MITHASLPDAGSRSHDTIDAKLNIVDAQLPTATEKTVLEDLANDGTIQIKVSTADVSNPPYDEELDAEFGTPATVGAGYLALVDDAGAGSAVYLVISDGTSWWYEQLTKAV